MKKYISIILSFCCAVSMISAVHAEDTSEPGMAVKAVNITDGTVYNEAGSAEQESGIAQISSSDPIHEIWKDAAPLNEERADCDTVVVNGDLYAIGGQNSTGYLYSIEKYNNVSDTWTTVTNIPHSPKGYAITVYEDNIYIIGGYTSDGYSGVTQVYNVSTDTWKTLKTMKKRRIQAIAAATDGKIYVFGGRDAFGIHKNYEYYDIASDTWTLVETKFDASLIRIGADAKTINGYIVAYGGFDVDGNKMGLDVYPIKDLNKRESILSANYKIVSVASGTDKAIAFAMNGSTSSFTEIDLLDTVQSSRLNITNTPTNNDSVQYELYNGYLYCVGGYLSPVYSSDVYKSSIYYGDNANPEQQGYGPAAAGNEITLTVESGKEYLIFLDVKNMPTFEKYKFTLEYGSGFSVTDACEFTSRLETTAAKIQNTDLTVTALTSSKISFASSEAVPSGKKVSKTVNVVRLKAKSSGTYTIKYSMEIE